VAYNANLKQRSIHLQTHRDRLSPRRLRRLRMGNRAERRLKLPSAWFLERYRPATTHHMEGALRFSTSGRVFFTPTERPTSPPPRGQHGGCRGPNQASLPVTRHDDRAPALVVPTRHERHPHPQRHQHSAENWTQKIGSSIPVCSHTFKNGGAPIRSIVSRPC
jgi:hypothetical protein